MRPSVQSLNYARKETQDDTGELHIFKYDGIAELYSARDRKSGRPSGYKRFDSVAEGIQFFIEQLPVASHPGAYLEVDDARLTHRDVQRLYDSAQYPLPRRVSAE